MSIVGPDPVQAVGSYCSALRPTGCRHTSTSSLSSLKLRENRAMEDFTQKNATEVGIFLKEKGVSDAVSEKFEGERVKDESNMKCLILLVPSG